MSQRLNTRMAKLADDLAAAHNQLLAVESIDEARTLQQAASALMESSARLRNALGFRILDLKKSSSVSTETTPAFIPTAEENRRVVGAIAGKEKATVLSD